LRRAVNECPDKGHYRPAMLLADFTRVCLPLNQRRQISPLRALGAVRWVKMALTDGVSGLLSRRVSIRSPGLEDLEDATIDVRIEVLPIKSTAEYCGLCESPACFIAFCGTAVSKVFPE
jgi:hypothetical protein